MNNRGFTLIEILAVIAILGIVMAIATSSYSSYFDSINEKNKDNSIEILKTIALDYFNETGNSTFFVNDLLTSGDLKANKNDSFFINDEDYKCYIINVNDVFESNNSETEIELTKSDIKEDGTCDTEKIEDNYILEVLPDKGGSIKYNRPCYADLTVISNAGEFFHSNRTSDSLDCKGNTSWTNQVYSIAAVKVPITYTATWKDVNGKITVKTVTVNYGGE